MMNAEHNLGLNVTDITLYDPTHVQKIEEAFFALFCGDYLFEFGFPLIDVGHLCALVGHPHDGSASTSSHGYDADSGGP